MTFPEANRAPEESQATPAAIPPIPQEPEDTAAKEAVAKEAAAKEAAAKEAGARKAATRKAGARKAAAKEAAAEEAAAKEAAAKEAGEAFEAEPLPAFEPTPIPDLIESSRLRSPGLILGAAVVLLAAISLLRWLVPDPLGQAGPVDPSPQATVYVAPSPTPRDMAPTAAAPLLPAVSPSPEGLEAHLAQAQSLVERSDFEEAIALYQDLVTQAPEDARPEIGWAWALLLDDQAGQAVTHALRAVELGPTNAEAMAVLARAYAESGDLAHALGMAQNAVQLDPSRVNAHTALAEVYFLQGDLAAAVNEASTALVLNGDDAEAHRIRAQLYEADNDLAAAIGELEAAARLQPRIWVHQYELGQAQLQAGDYETAVVTLKTALGLRRKATTYAAVGEAYYGLGQYDRAQAFLQQALSAGAADANTYALLAALDAQQGRCEDAGIFIDQALTLDPASGLAAQARNTCQGGSAAAGAPAGTPASGTAAATPAAGATAPAAGVTAAPSPVTPSLGGWIAFPVWNHLSATYDTYMARPDGGERQLVAENMHQPAFSPDSQWLAVNGERSGYLNLSIVRPDGSDLREISEYIEDGLPCWSPDSSRLAFSSTRQSDRQSRVYVIDQVPFDGKKVTGRVLNANGYEVLGQYPAWTADDQIVYVGCDYASTPVECGLFAIPAQAGPQTARLLTTQPEDTAPAAFGSHIAFTSNRDGNWEIYVVDSDGSALKRLTNNAVNDGLPTWSPDGRTLAFVSDQGGVWAVWAMNADGTGRRKLFDIGGGGLVVDWQQERITWAP
jgi:tetratricopeptide (TPR) repeat protein